MSPHLPTVVDNSYIYQLWYLIATTVGKCGDINNQQGTVFLRKLLFIDTKEFDADRAYYYLLENVKKIQSLNFAHERERALWLP
jgi:hypothetical protein